jgi:hypothetical protein
MRSESPRGSPDGSGVANVLIKYQKIVTMMSKNIERGIVT